MSLARWQRPRGDTHFPCKRGGRDMSSFSMIRRLVLASLVVAGAAAPAAAYAETRYVTVTQERVDMLQARADVARARADFLARVGQGWGYNSGAIDRAKAEAYSAQAE